MDRLTRYINGIAVPVPELYLAGNNAGIPKENLNNYVIKNMSVIRAMVWQRKRLKARTAEDVL